MTPLHWAAQYGNADICQLILKNVENKNPKDSYGGTPLHCAAIHGSKEICDLFLENCDILDKNPKNHYGQTPLHWAAEHGHVEVCRSFLDILAVTDPQNNRSQTPKTLASRNNYNQIVNLFNEY